MSDESEFMIKMKYHFKKTYKKKFNNCPINKKADLKWYENPKYKFFFKVM